MMDESFDDMEVLYLSFDMSVCIATSAFVECDLSCRESRVSLVMTMHLGNRQEVQHRGLARQPTQHQAGKKGLVALQ